MLATEQWLDLIDRNALLRETVWLCGGFVDDPFSVGYMEALDKVETVIRNAPTIEARPVVHGEWSTIEDDYCGLIALVCSECKAQWWFEDSASFDKYHYCPNCGAKMDGGADGERITNTV